MEVLPWVMMKFEYSESVLARGKAAGLK